MGSDAARATPRRSKVRPTSSLRGTGECAQARRVPAHDRPPVLHSEYPPSRAARRRPWIRPYSFELLKHGTAGLAYLLKERVGDLDELLRALREVVAGRSVIDARVVELLVAHRARLAESPVSTLSPRELDVLRGMAQGKTNR